MKYLVTIITALVLTSCDKNKEVCKIYETNNSNILEQIEELKQQEQSLETSVKITVLEQKLKENSSKVVCK